MTGLMYLLFDETNLMQVTSYAGNISINGHMLVIFLYLGTVMGQLDDIIK